MSSLVMMTPPLSAEMTHTSIEDTEKLVTLLLAKLTKNDCNVKYKVLMVIKVR